MNYRGGSVALFKVIDGSTHVLLGRRVFNPGKGLWTFPGGGANEGETLGRAALREFREETGKTLSKKCSKVVGSLTLNYLVFSWKTLFVETTQLILPKKGKLEVLSKSYRYGEFSEICWVPLDELKNYPLHFGVKEAVAKYLKETLK